MLLGLFAKFLAFWRNSVVYGKLCDLYPACGGIIKCWCYLMLGPGLGCDDWSGVCFNYKKGHGRIFQILPMLI